jgi:hypothetical protein
VTEFDGGGERALSVRPLFADARRIFIQERRDTLGVSERGGDR